MKRLIAITGFIIFSVSLIRAQNGLVISLEAGPTFPIGNFGQENEGEDGYAKSGWAGSGSAAYQINENIRVGAKGGFLTNGVQENAIDFVDNSPWESAVILGQVTFSQPLSSNLFLELEGGAGLIQTKFPDATISIGGFNLTRNGETGRGLAWQLGGGFRYDLSRDFAFRLSGNYLNGKPGFDDGGERYTQDIGLINLNWGILFML